MAELLLELFSEEIPARMQARAADDLKRLVTERLSAAQLVFERAEAHVTPRRLCLVVDGLPKAQPDVSEERRGPRVGAPEPAIEGFLKGAGVTLAQCERRDTGKGVFWFAVVQREGRPTFDLLPELLGEAIAQLPWPKSMRWGSHDVRWVRPLHSIVCLFDGAVVPLSFGPVAAGRTTFGHRFMAPEPIEVASFAQYRDALRKAHVVLDRTERRAMIAREVERLAGHAGLSVKPDEGLLDEVAGLVEWPVVLLGSIDREFMDVPAEVLSTAMRTHQKYFSLLSADGSFAPTFAVVANTATGDGGAAVVAGNERVLRARLSDAKFFWDQDRKVTLADRVPALKDRVFYAGLGTMADKVERIRKLAVALAPFVPEAEPKQIDRTALLAKADLSSGMVGEFPELQGVMGRYYARHDGEGDEVAQAVAEHYSPLGPNDTCPTFSTSVAVALADKIDSLVGFFAIGEKPTGSKDPFALRRAALGVIRLILENGLRLPLARAFGVGLESYLMQRQAGAVSAHFADPAADLLDFFADRLKVHLREEGVRHDLVSAVFALGGEDDLVRLLARVEALRGFLATEDGGNLLVAYRRASNIVRIEEKKDDTVYAGDVNPRLLVQEEERTLFDRLGEVGERSAKALKVEEFERAMAELSRLRKPVDAFFDRVTVNAEERELRVNRLHLLSGIRATLGQVADFSKIEG